MKMQDMKPADQSAWHEEAGSEIAGFSIVGPKNARPTSF